jgi:hypothetical protein
MWCHAAADSELVWTNDHEKLGVGVIEESHNKLWYEFPVGGQGPGKHREGVEDRDDLGSCEMTEGASVPEGLRRMFARSGEGRRGNLTF